MRFVLAEPEEHLWSRRDFRRARRIMRRLRRRRGRPVLWGGRRRDYQVGGAVDRQRACRSVATVTIGFDGGGFSELVSVIAARIPTHPSRVG